MVGAVVNEKELNSLLNYQYSAYYQTPNDRDSASMA